MDVGEDDSRYFIVPEEVREMAGWVIRNCVQATGLGGFVTRNISDAISYVTRPGSNLSTSAYRMLEMFLYMLNPLR